MCKNIFISLSYVKQYTNMPVIAVILPVQMDVRDRQLLLSNEGRKWAASHKMM